MKHDKIEVFYGGELDAELDDKIRVFFKSLGYQSRTGSGYNLLARTRDMDFEPVEGTV